MLFVTKVEKLIVLKVAAAGFLGLGALYLGYTTKNCIMFRFKSFFLIFFSLKKEKYGCHIGFLNEKE